MTTNRTVITSLKPKRRKNSENNIPKWSIFSLSFITTLVIVSLIQSYLPLLISALAMLFVWSQMTKPIAEIKTKTTNYNSDQLNLFNRQLKIGHQYSKIKKVLEEDIDRNAA
tara:strand:+ start:136 stop:471 length:336 start_codon:yes stop_codon:yes gene_type:complete